MAMRSACLPPCLLLSVSTLAKATWIWVLLARPMTAIAALTSINHIKPERDPNLFLEILQYNSKPVCPCPRVESGLFHRSLQNLYPFYWKRKTVLEQNIIWRTPSKRLSKERALYLFQKSLCSAIIWLLIFPNSSHVEEKKGSFMKGFSRCFIGTKSFFPLLAVIAIYFDSYKQSQMI